MAKHNDFEFCNSYATHKNAMKKLEQLLAGVSEDDRPQTLIAVNNLGRFVPVAVGQKAAQLGLHFHIPIVG